MSRVPSANNAAAAAKPKRSLPAARAPVRPAWELPPRDTGPSPPLTRASPTTQLDSFLRSPLPPGALSLRGESRRPAEARRGPELPFPPRAPRERRYGSRSSAFSSLSRGRLRPSGPPTGPRAPGSPPTQATRGSEAPAPRQVIDPRGNSVRCLQPPPRARAPSGLRRLLPALPPPPPEKAPRKPPHFPSRPRRRSAGRPFGQERPL